MDKNSKDWKQPKPLKWRHKDCGCELHKGWTYKRNYMATTYDVDGDRYKYWIHEVSDKENPKLVLAMDDWDFPYDIQERCEQLLKAFAKGKMPGLNKNEKRLIEEGEGEFRPENIKFIPYKEEA